MVGNKYVGETASGLPGLPRYEEKEKRSMRKPKLSEAINRVQLKRPSSGRYLNQDALIKALAMRRPSTWGVALLVGRVPKTVCMKSATVRLLSCWLVFYRRHPSTYA